MLTRPEQLDIMDRGTNAVSCLRGEIIPLSLGYVGACDTCALRTRMLQADATEWPQAS